MILHVLCPTGGGIVGARPFLQSQTKNQWMRRTYQKIQKASGAL